MGSLVFGPLTEVATQVTSMSVTRPDLVAGSPLIAFLGYQGREFSTGPPNWVRLGTLNSVGLTSTTGPRVDVWMKLYSSVAVDTESVSYTWSGAADSRKRWGVIARADGVHDRIPTVDEMNFRNRSDNTSVPTFAVDAVGKGILISFNCFQQQSSLAAGDTNIYSVSAGMTEIYERMVSPSTTSTLYAPLVTLGTAPVAGPGVVSSYTWTRTGGASSTIDTAMATFTLVDSDVVLPPEVTLPITVYVKKIGEQFKITATATNNPTSWSMVLFDENCNARPIDSKPFVPTIPAPVVLSNTEAELTLTGQEPGAFTIEILATNPGGTSAVPRYANVVIIESPTQIEGYDPETNSWVPGTLRFIPNP